MKPYSPSRWLSHIIFIVFSATFGLLVSSCAALPDLHSLDGSLNPPATPTIANGKGVLNQQKARSLLSKRWRNSHTDMAALAKLEEAATGSPLIAGNKVTLLYDGPDTMKAMIEAIKQAKNHINLETYIFDQDELGQSFANLLIERQRAGVQVNIIYDSVGTIGVPQEFFDNMKNAGIHLLAFNPVNPFKLIGPWQPNNRDHRKILVVDGKVAFTGGVNISRSYGASSIVHAKKRRKTQVGWRDTHIRIEGPAVAALQWTFLNNWVSQNAPELPDNDFFPPLPEVGNKLVRVLASEPGGNFDIYKAYLIAIREAKKSIHITCAYFVPDAQTLKALQQAAQRGVEVKLILPSVTDSDLVRHASESFYSEILASGIKIYQLKIAVLHAKTAVIDGVWGTVGSTNIDTRSFLHNKEINVIVFDEEFGAALEKAFSEDLSYSKEITAASWAQRPAANQIKEWMARQFQYWL